jgi:hypothetical protein
MCPTMTLTAATTTLEEEEEEQEEEEAKVGGCTSCIQLTHSVQAASGFDMLTTPLEVADSPRLKGAWLFQPLKLEFDILVSIQAFAFKFNLYRYVEEVEARDSSSSGGRGEAAAAAEAAEAGSSSSRPGGEACRRCGRSR